MDFLENMYKPNGELTKYAFPRIVEHIGVENLQEFAKSSFEDLDTRHADLLDWIRNDLLNSEPFSDKFTNENPDDKYWDALIILNNFYLWLHHNFKEMELL